MSSLGTGPPRHQQSLSAHSSQSKTRNQNRNGQVAISFDLLVEGVGVWPRYGPYPPSQCKAQVVRDWSSHSDSGYDNGLNGLPRPMQVMWNETTSREAVSSGRRR